MSETDISKLRGLVHTSRVSPHDGAGYAPRLHPAAQILAHSSGEMGYSTYKCRGDGDAPTLTAAAATTRPPAPRSPGGRRARPTQPHSDGSVVHGSPAAPQGARGVPRSGRATCAQRRSARTLSAQDACGAGSTARRRRRSPRRRCRLFGKKNIPEPAFVYRPTRKEGYAVKNHLGQPFVRARAAASCAPTASTSSTSRGRAPAGAAASTCATSPSSARSSTRLRPQAIDGTSRRATPRGRAPLDHVAFAEDDAKEVAAAHALWCSAVAADNVDGSLDAFFSPRSRATLTRRTTRRPC